MSLTALGYVVLFVGFIALGFLRHPIWGLHAYLLTFYMGPDSAWWSYQLPDLRWSLTSAFMTLLSVLMHRPEREREPWYGFRPMHVLVVFAIWLWIQMLWAMAPDSHLFLAILFTKYIVIFATIYACLDSQARVREFVFAHVLGCFWWGILAWQQHRGGRLEDIGTADASGSAFASMHVSTALALAGFMVISSRGARRWISAAAIPWILNAVVLMQTRAAFLALVAAVPAAYFLGPPSKRKISALFLVLGVGAFSYVANQEFWERMSTIKAEEGQEMEASAASRFAIAEANLAMAKDHPFGVGHRGNDLLSPIYMPENLLTTRRGGRFALRIIL